MTDEIREFQGTAALLLGQIERGRSPSTKWLIACENALRALRDEEPLELCPVCEGDGGSEFQHDPSPQGVGLAAGTMTDWSECSRCHGAGIIPTDAIQLQRIRSLKEICEQRALLMIRRAQMSHDTDEERLWIRFRDEARCV